MNRRRYLALLGAGALSASAGCLGGVDRSSGTRTGSKPRASGGYAGSDASRYRAVSLPVPEDELVRSAPKDEIPAIVDPVFAPDYDGVEATLDRSTRVIGVARGGGARAYPLRLLDYYEVVNDSLDGPLLVTYCPLCASAVVADRVVDGSTTQFDVSGHLWRSDLVLYDAATESLWSQVLATAISGDLTGTQWRLRPSTVTTWGRWVDENPTSAVLLPPPTSRSINGVYYAAAFERDPYRDYRTSRAVGVGEHSNVDGRLHPKTRVVGMASDGVARAYPWPAVRRAGVVNDTVGELPVAVAALDDGTMGAFVRRVGGETVRVRRAGDRLRAAGSAWSVVTGRAVSGPHAGEVLGRANDRSAMYWFAWAAFFPRTEIHGTDRPGVDDEAG